MLGIHRGTGFGSAQDNTLSWTRNGTPIPAENRPEVLFDQLFRKDSPEQLATREQRQALNGSILDHALESIHKLEKQVGAVDKAKLDEYFYSIRDTEEN